MGNFKETKKYHYTYKTTNSINGRYYLGMHSTNRLDDNYLGSGKRLYYEIAKYGRDNFKLEILKFYNSRDELARAETLLITEQDLKNINCLNCKPGGTGGFTDVSRKKARQVTDSILFLKYGENFRSESSKQAYAKLTEEERSLRKDKIREGLAKVNYNHATMRGKTHTEESKQKMSEAKKGRGTGKSNSQFGTMWITNGIENTKIPKEGLIPVGWSKGRVVEQN
jgi:hypothetical protein